MKYWVLVYMVKGACIYAKYMQKNVCKGFLTKDYLTCNHGKCCEFRVMCPCIVQKVQNLRHSLYVSWSSGLTPSLLVVVRI